MVNLWDAAGQLGVQLDSADKGCKWELLLHPGNSIGRGGRRGLVVLVTFSKTLDAAGGVDQLLFPVKKGWQLEQISTWMLPLWVERVWKELPQAQFTVTTS